jgi:hypothetical protein
LRTSRELAGATLFLTIPSLNFASAADLPVKAPPMVAAVSNWTGFYVGGLLGSGQDSSSTSELWVWNTTYPTGSLVGCQWRAIVGGGPTAQQLHHRLF